MLSAPPGILAACFRKERRDELEARFNHSSTSILAVSELAIYLCFFYRDENENASRNGIPFALSTKKIFDARRYIERKKEEREKRERFSFDFYSLGEQSWKKLVRIFAQVN